MSTRKAKFYRSNFFWSAVVIAMLVTPFLVKFAISVWELKRHHPVKDKMDLAILRLSLECPQGLSDNQWAYCVCWTWILHGNYGCLPCYVPTEDLERIAAELNQRIDLGADSETINWIWDQYILAYPRIAVHEDWRPTGPERKEEFDLLKDNAPSLDPNSEASLLHWRERYWEKLAEVKPNN
jgi:hypothetical protein